MVEGFCKPEVDVECSSDLRLVPVHQGAWDEDIRWGEESPDPGGTQSLPLA